MRIRYTGVDTDTEQLADDLAHLASQIKERETGVKAVDTEHSVTTDEYETVTLSITFVPGGEPFEGGYTVPFEER